MRTLTVALGERSYPIHVGEGILKRCGELLPALPSRRAVVVTNPVVAPLHLDSLQAALAAAGIRHEVIVVPDGETHKDWATLYEIHTRLLELGAERSTTLIALGGGVIGDLADLRRRPTSGVFRSSRFPRRCWRKWTRRSAARRPSIIRGAKT